MDEGVLAELAREYRGWRFVTPFGVPQGVPPAETQPTAPEAPDIGPFPSPGEITMQDDVVALFAYDRWANRKVLDACRKLTAEQYVAEPAPGCSSVRSTVYHIARVTEIHLRTLAGDPDDSIPTEADLAALDDAPRFL